MGFLIIDDQTLFAGLFLLGALAVAMLFMLTQHRILSALKPESRSLSPGKVWLQLVPVLGIIWQFVVVIRIADSLRKERIFRLGDSLVSSADGSSAQPASIADATLTRPPLAQGITFCCANLGFLLYCGLTFNEKFTTDDRDYIAFRQIILPFLLSVFALTSWISYWVNLVQTRRRLIRSA